MTGLLERFDMTAAVVLIIVLPVLIVGAGEVQERLRQRGSPLEKPIATVRNWVLPLAALWVLVVSVFNLSESALASQVLATALLIAATAATLQAVRYITEHNRQLAKIPGTRSVPQLFMMLPRLIVLLVAAWLLFAGVWNVDLTGLFAALGVTSLVVSLALQDTLSGLASGFLILGDRPFSPGDWITVNDIEGRVVDTNWRSSRIHDRNGDLHIVPNSTLSAASLVNHDEPGNLHRVVVSLQVAYSNPPTNAKEMLLAAARSVEGVLEDPPPLVRVTQIDDPLMGYDVQMWIDDYAIQPRVRSDFGSLVWYQSHRMDVPLPSPAYDLYHHDPIQEEADAALTTGDVISRIRRAAVFAELDSEDLTALGNDAVAERFARGEVILPAGSVNRDVLVLWEGRARILVAEYPDAFIDLSDGDVFGVVSRSTRDETPQEVVAIADCEVIRIGSAAAGIVASRNPALADELNQIMKSRSRRLQPLPEEFEIAAPQFAATGDESGDGGTAEEAETGSQQ